MATAADETGSVFLPFPHTEAKAECIDTAYQVLSLSLFSMKVLYFAEDILNNVLQCQLKKAKTEEEA